MLVLSRQRDESIMVGDDIEVTVVDVRGDKVRLGITAPKDVSVHRKEVWEAIRRQTRGAWVPRPTAAAETGEAVGPQVMPKVNGKSFRCSCGCNVFTETSRGGGTIHYICNACRAAFTGEAAPPCRPVPVLGSIDAGPTLKA